MMDLSRLRGILVPVLTPLEAGEERVDTASLGRLVDFVLEGGVHGIWVMGTTGEFATLPETERARAVRAAVERVNGRVPVVASVGDSSTALALRHARAAAEAGADALALTPPHYYPHTMDEVQAHFRAVKAAVPDLPLLVYNIPPMVKVKMTVAATLELAREGTVQGIKDSQNDLRWFRDLVLGARADGLGDRFRTFLGSPDLLDAAVVVGAHGDIPSSSNIAPGPCAEAWEAAERGDFARAEKAVERVKAYMALASIARGGSDEAALYSAMKLALRSWGVIASAGLTRPLREMGPDEAAELEARLASMPRGTERVSREAALA